MRVRVDVFTVAVCAMAAVTNLVAFAFNVTLIPEEPVFRSLWATVQVGLAVWMFLLARRGWRRFIAARVDARLAAWMNVRVLRDGQELPVRLGHLGVRDDGQDVWVVLEPDLQFGDELVGRLPLGSVIIGGFAGSADP